MRSFVLVGCIVAGSCATPPLRSTVIVAPDEFPGFPSHAESGDILAEATYFTNHEDIFLRDLTRDGYVPVALRIGTRGNDGVVRRLSRDTVDLHLYLQDGTPLSWIPYDMIEYGGETTRNRIDQESLVFSVLPDWHASKTGFVFFRFEEPVRVERTHALNEHEPYYRELDLLHSVVSLTVTTDEGPQKIFVGLRTGHFSTR